MINAKQPDSPKKLETLLNLQRNDGEYLTAYVDHLHKLDEILFDLGSQIEVNFSKAEIFELLNQNRLLCNDLMELIK